MAERLRRFSRGTVARWAWPVTTLALGAALIGTAAANYRSTHGAADDLLRGQAQGHRDALLQRTRPDEWTAPGVLERVLEAQKRAGLLSISLVTDDGALVASVGQPSAVPLDRPQGLRGVRIDHLGDRVRAYLPPFGPPGSAEPDAAGEPRPRPPTIVAEFSATEASALLARSEQSLAVAVAVALFLMAAGVLLWRMAQRMERAERRLEEQRRLSALGEMSAVLAHEIRNPLASLKGHAQLLLERTEPGAPEYKKVRRVVDEAIRLESLTNDLLDFARSGPLNVSPTDPGQLLRDTAAEVAGDGIVVETLGAPPEWPLDARRFGAGVLANLLRNATQASPSDQPPHARATLEGGCLVFTVRDFGSGLPVGAEDRIFEPFYTTRTNGTGLGLAVARRLVELHGGRLLAANAPDGGAVFRIELSRGAG